MERLILLGFMLISCASWAPTRNAQVRRREGWALASCWQSVGCSDAFVKQCVRESEARCKASGLENSCGVDEYWTDRGLWCKRN